jgi:hypothetical protein
MPRGRTVKTGSVDSGQSIVRPTTTASLLSFQRMRVHAAAGGAARRTSDAPTTNIVVARITDAKYTFTFRTDCEGSIAQRSEPELVVRLACVVVGDGPGPVRGYTSMTCFRW